MNEQRNFKERRTIIEKDENHLLQPMQAQPVCSSQDEDGRQEHASLRALCGPRAGLLHAHGCPARAVLPVLGAGEVLAEAAEKQSCV